MEIGDESYDAGVIVYSVRSRVGSKREYTFTDKSASIRVSSKTRVSVRSITGEGAE